MKVPDEKLCLSGQALPANENYFLDRHHLDPVKKTDVCAELFHKVPNGLRKWTVHPDLKKSELVMLEPGGNHLRQVDFDFRAGKRYRDKKRNDTVSVSSFAG